MPVKNKHENKREIENVKLTMGFITVTSKLGKRL